MTQVIVLIVGAGISPFLAGDGVGVLDGHGVPKTLNVTAAVLFVVVSPQGVLVTPTCSRGFGVAVGFLVGFMVGFGGCPFLRWEYHIYLPL